MAIPEFVEYVKKKYAECKFKDCLDVIEDIQRRMFSIVSDDIDLLEEYWKRMATSNIKCSSNGWSRVSAEHANTHKFILHYLFANQL